MKQETIIASIEVPDGWNIEQQGTQIKLRYKSRWRRLLYWFRGKVKRRKRTIIEFQDPDHPGKFIEIGHIIED